LGLFEDLHDLGVTIVVITHDRDIAARLGRRIEMLDGQIVFDSADKAAVSPMPAPHAHSSGKDDRP
jgi:putative ABC transport system ATP-binding protein